jgi:hypothetical protein
MKNNKLLSLLSTFTLRDWQQFGGYIRSPFFNQTETLIRLADELEVLYRQGQLPEPPIKKSKLYRKLFPGSPYDDANFNRMCSRLLQLAAGFLAYQAWQSDGIMANYYTLQAFFERKLDKHFRFTFQKTKNQLEQEPFRNPHFYQQQYLLSEMAEWQLSGNKTQGFGPQVQEAADCFDQYMIVQKLQHLCTLASLNKLQPDTYTIQYREEIIRMSEPLQHLPIVAIYRNLYLMIMEKEAAPFFQHLKDLTITHEAILAQRELKFLYLSLINFCIGRIRHGEKIYAHPLLELYETSLKKGFLMDNDQISPWTFKNVVKLGLGLQRFDWVETFIHQYGPLLADRERSEAMSFNLADLYYHRQDYDQAQLYLREVEFSDIRYYLHGRILLAKIYYTTQSWESLDSLLASFRVYLMRSKKMSREEKRPYLNFIRILDKLLNSLPEKRAKIRESILETPMLTDRSWLLEITD